jgi:DNA-binding MarR family transcriptional regulator
VWVFPHGRAFPLLGGAGHRGELHTITAVGQEPGLSLKRLAELTGVTKGAASQMVSRLVRKGYVTKGPAPGAPREIALDLTELGRRARAAHAELHAGMHATVRAYYGADTERRVTEATRVVRELIGLVESHRP